MASVRKGFEKVFWIVIVIIIAMVMGYIIIKIGGANLHKFGELVSSGIEKSNQTVQEGMKNITGGKW